MKVVSSLPTADLVGKKVLVRADLNVPRTSQGDIINDFKLQSILPTLKLIKARGGKIVVIGHSGRPTSPEKKLSLSCFVDWFEKHGLSTVFADTIEKALSLQKQPYEVILLENLRFFPGEQKADQAFAQSLALLGNYFVQDSSGTLHRNDTSMTLLAHCYKPEEKTVGLLVEKELALLSHLSQEPRQPFIIILGGNKTATKLPIIEHLLDLISAVLPCPAVVFTLLQAHGISVGKSFVDESSLTIAQNILQRAKKEGIDFVFPLDYLVTKESFEKPLNCSITKNIGPDHTGVSFGPETSRLFKECILQARTIFLNGISGNPEYPETVEGMRSLFQALQQTCATKVIGGGDTVAVAQKLGFDETMGTFLTGGGSTLAFLSGKNLPGLIALR